MDMLIYDDISVKSVTVAIRYQCVSILLTPTHVIISVITH